MASHGSPLFTTLMRTYNSQATLPLSLASLRSQTLPPRHYSILVVDDGSTDSTLSILSTSRDAIRIIRLKHRGAIPALNVGLQKAPGKYVILLDADDTFDPNILREMYSVIKRNPTVAFVYSNYYDYELESEKRKLVVTKGNVLLTVAGGIMYNKEVLLECGFFDPSLFFPEYDLLMKIQQKGYRGIHIDKPLYNYRRQMRSMTADPKMVQVGLEQLYHRYGVRLPIREY